jgi:uncharacterized protein
MNPHIFTPDEQKLLLNIADQAIKYGLEHRDIMPINLQDYPQKLQQPGACFVTLKMNNLLRGCIGSLEAHEPLAINVAKNAYAAAFEDPRFVPLTAEEYPQLTKHISILTAPQPMHFTSEEDLLRQLRPKIDGLILMEEGYRGTFLPAVWEELPDPKIFLQHLKLKAGLPQNHWSNTLKVSRYTAESIEE